MKTIPHILFSVLIISISSCMKEEEIVPITSCNNSWEYETHPKQTTYQSILEKYTSKGITGINVLIDKKGEEIWAGTAGYASIENQSSLELCNIMPIASVGKLYCGIVTMQLVEEGILDLDKTIDQYLPMHLIDKIPNSSSADIANLLSHTSGIPDYADNPNLMFDFLNDNNLNFSREAILEEYVYCKKPKFSPGIEYSYSNSNYEILTIIIDHVLGTSHANRYTNNIFTPLGLSNTYYKNETDYFDLYSKGFVSGYFDRHSDGRIENATDLSLTITKGQTGSDGVITSIHELHTFMKAIFDASLISNTTLTTMKEYIKARHNFVTYKYGLGITFRDKEKNFELANSIGHSGSLPGYATESWFFPDSETYIIYSANCGNILNGPISDLLEEFREELYKEVLK